jgi:hypothetical protein
LKWAEFIITPILSENVDQVFIWSYHEKEIRLVNEGTKGKVLVDS